MIGRGYRFRLAKLVAVRALCGYQTAAMLVLAIGVVADCKAILTSGVR
jgi:hypothetical protein